MFLSMIFFDGNLLSFYDGGWRKNEGRTQKHKQFSSIFHRILKYSSKSRLQIFQCTPLYMTMLVSATRSTSSLVVSTVTARSSCYPCAKTASRSVFGIHSVNSRSLYSSSVRSQRVRQVVMMSASPVYEITVKGNQETNTLADCPFSHRALLCLEEKKVPYTRKYVDLDNKPQWLLDLNPAGTVPVMKELATGEWTVGSDVVSDLLEAKHPEPVCGTVEGSPQVAGSLLGAFKGFLNADGEEETAEKEAALVAVLKELDDFLKTTNPYIGGASPCQTDFLVMPRLYHLKVACKHFRGWEIPAEFTSVLKYMDDFMSRDSWKNTYYSPELVIKGWERHGVVVRT